jgi:hydrogenase/urease accessory protein HupE
MKGLARWLMGVCSLLAPVMGSAHELRPASLELRETQSDAFDVLWKVPSLGATQRVSLTLHFPEGTAMRGRPTVTQVEGAEVQRYQIHRPGGLDGERIDIDGLISTWTDVLVRIERLSGATQIARLSAERPSLVVEAEPDAQEIARIYFGLGVQHILQGIDHLLFVFGLLLIVGDRWMLAKTVTSFTVAHSITLAVATLGYARAPLAPLNSAIALSILFLGPEIVRVWRGQTSFTIRHPWVAAFGFGLLHGFGFASGLNAMGLPPVHIPLALLFFNVGVEAGQIGFVLIILSTERSFRVLEIVCPRWASMIPGYVVGVSGAYWFIQRTVILFRGVPG